MGDLQYEMGSAGKLAGMLVDSVVEVTFVPYLTLACAAVNTILIHVIKKQAAEE